MSASTTPPVSHGQPWPLRLHGLRSVVPAGTVSGEADLLLPMLVLVVLLGAVTGFVNAAIIIRLKVSSLIATPGTASVMQAAARLYMAHPIVAAASHAARSGRA